MNLASSKASAVSDFDEKSNPLGLLTLFGTWALAWVAAFKGPGFESLTSAIRLFFGGDVGEIKQTIATPLQLVSVAGAFLVLSLPLAALVGAVIDKCLGKADNFLTQMFRGAQERRYFRMVFLTVLLEELFARWLFLGLGQRVWHGSVAIYVLFFLGNSAWALVHLYNTTNASQRNPLRVLTQFVVGALLTVVYLQYGFMAVLLIHFAFDALVFSTNKRQKWGRSSVLLALYNSLIAGVSYMIMTTLTDTNLSSTASWFSDSPKFDVPGWGLADYFLYATLVSALLAIVLECLAFDQDNIELIREDDAGIVASIAGAMMLVAASFAVFELLGLIMTSMPHRVIVVSLLLLLISSGISGSAMARTFWETFPLSYILFACLIGLGFWAGLVFVVMRFAISMPVRAIMRTSIE